MNVIHKARVQKRASVVLAALAFFAAATPSANANYGAAKPAEQAVTVIAHLDLPGASVSQLVLQENGGNQYLYVRQASTEGFLLVNVTNPSRPNVIKRAASPNDASTGRLELISGGLALAEGRDGGSAAAEPRPSTGAVKVLDLSDPANPRVVLSFSGVTSTLQDDARNLVFITNGEGLWILRNNQALAAAANQHRCNSDDAYSDVAACR